MNPKKFSVEGKVTIVTGGGTGVGAGIAREFALNGAPVLIASRKAENLEKIRDQIRPGRRGVRTPNLRRPRRVRRG